MSNVQDTVIDPYSLSSKMSHVQDTVIASDGSWNSLPLEIRQIIIGKLLDNASSGISKGVPVDQKDIYVLNRTFGYNDCLRPVAQLIEQLKTAQHEVQNLMDDSPLDRTSGSEELVAQTARIEECKDKLSALYDSVKEVGILLEGLQEQKVSISDILDTSGTDIHL